jgi:hypothetical protein
MPDLATALKNAINKIDTTKENQMQNVHNATSNTSINEVLHQWDNDPAKDAGQHKVASSTTFKPTNNVSQETFNLIKSHPGCTYRVLCDMAAALGFKRTSVGSISTQFVRVGMVRKDEDGRMYVTQSAYTPIKYKDLRKAQRASLKKVTKSKADSVARAATRQYIKSGKYSQKITDTGIAALGTQAKHTIAVANNTPAAPLTQSVTNFDADQLLSALSFNQAIALYKKLKAMLGDV